MKIALIGNQNSGKTTIFNCLTGMNAKIGNWPGVTIEKKEGIIKGTKHEIVDLPGIYSLSPYSMEEKVARKFIFEEDPDIIINILDATCLERSLYLTTQLLESNCNVIVILNMMDKLEESGTKIDEKKLERYLGTKVFKVSALKQTGIKEVIQELDKVHSNKKKKEPTYLKNNFDINEYEKIANKKYEFIEQVAEECLEKKERKESCSDKLDKIFLNKWLAFPIFILIMFFIYYLSVGVVGKLTTDWIENTINIFSRNISKTMLNEKYPKWIESLIVDGVISGVGAVISFIPQLTILFLCISLLETTGYMSRIALLLDKIFRKIGLSGKSLIPFIIGSGCSVPGIMGVRIIENEDERKMTAILTPFIPCSAKLPIIALFTEYFFPKYPGLASTSLYFFAIAVIVLSSIIMKKLVFKNTASTYISELPEYKIPSIKYVVKEVLEKVLSFIKRAGSIILFCSIAIWFLLSFSFNMKYGVSIEESILASIGKKISWVFAPMLGVNSWEATVSAIQGLVAKEQVVSSMAVISGLSTEIKEGGKIFSGSGAFSFFTVSSAYAFMVFNLFSAPCFGAIGAMRKELGSLKRLLKALTFQTVIAWVLATCIYQIGSRIENKLFNITDGIFIIIIIVIIILMVKSIFGKTGCRCENCYKNIQKT